MRFKLILLGIIHITVMLHTSCSPPASQDLIEEPHDDLIAKVVSVNKIENYALIQRYRKLKLEGDTILYAVGLSNETTSLKFTGEQLGQFAAVDIVSGNPRVGDGVFLKKLKQSQENEPNSSNPRDGE